MFEKATIMLAICSLAGTALAEVTIRTEEPYPIRGEATHVIIEDESGPMEGAIVQVEYRPNSSTPRVETLKPADQSGMILWTPGDAGLVRFSVTGPDGATANTAVSVRFTRFEPAGIVIMIFAGFFLFGGAAFGISLLLRERKVPAEEPPST